MNLKAEFKNYLKNKKKFAEGYADDLVTHINRISECYEVTIDHLFDPSTIKVFGRLDDETLDKTDYKRWMNALRYYIEFLNQFMSLKVKFKDYLLMKKGFAVGYADNLVAHINCISNCYEVTIDDLFDPSTIKVFGRLDDDTLNKTDYKRWMNALRHYIEFLNQL